MRKGADCLSKWVGESERQLRLLFDQVSCSTSHACVLHLEMSSDSCLMQVPIPHSTGLSDETLYRFL